MFEGSGKSLSKIGLQQSADPIGIALPALWAVTTVETKGCGFLPDRRPQILFERHKFHERTGGKFDTKAPDLSNSVPGGYGVGGAFQYDRLERAIKLDRTAALESTSWGMGQIMGFNATDIGFADVEAMVDAMCESEDAQLNAVASFINHNKLSPYLQQNDWGNFARHYNGPSYQTNHYDTKLASAAARYRMGPLPDLQVRAAQLYLTYLGFEPGTVDGWFGRQTQSALISFQQYHGLEASGHLDEATGTALEEAVS